MRLWCGPNITHDLTFPKLLHCFILVRKGQTAQCCFQTTKLNSFLGEGCLNVFFCFLFSTFLSQILKCYEVYEFGKKVKTLMQTLRWAVRNRKLASFYEKKTQNAGNTWLVTKRQAKENTKKKQTIQNEEQDSGSDAGTKAEILKTGEEITWHQEEKWDTGEQEKGQRQEV